jgi:hypothetical protein
MDKPIIIKSIFMFVCLWGIGIMLLWFRHNIEIFWKIVATLILGFYIWFFFEEISKGYAAFMVTNGWQAVTINFLKEFTAIIYSTLFFLWPLSLIIIFYKSNDIGAQRLLKFMCIITLIIWIVYVIYAYYDKGLNDFIEKYLKQILQKLKLK